jgi:hypothetical protein
MDKQGLNAMKRIQPYLQKIFEMPWTPHVAALAGGITYILSALQIARTKTSFLDEGLYLYKGYLFATGQQTPFADYGVLTNHSILSFLIPGYVQKWFGPGLDTGRYFMIFLSLFTLLGLWIFARRWGNAWWAAATVWVMALNPAEIKIHTLAISEGPVAAMLVWILLLTIGEKRPRWQVLLGAVLTAPLVLTRENMAFVPPILFLYIFWQHGWKTGLLAMLCSGVAFLGGNAFYFPDNLKLWATRLPAPLSPILESQQSTSSFAGADTELTVTKLETANLYRMFLYFWLTFRLHFMTLVSAVTVWLLWPSKITRPLTDRVRAAIFLSVMLLVLFIAHMQAAFFGDYCISCILLYIGYFDFIGLMLLVTAIPFLTRELSRFRQVVIFLVIILLILGIGFSSHEDLSADFAKAMIERLDRVYLWNALLYVTGLPQLVLFRTSFVLLAGTLILLLGGIGLWLGSRRFNGGQDAGRKTGFVALNILLIAGLILSPTGILGRGNDFFDCGGEDVFASYERAGKELSSVVEPGSKVYWEGRIPAVFLYMPDVQIYPPQLNHIHSFFGDSDSDALLRSGHWNDELARKWLAEADYILVQKSEMFFLNDQMLESGEYVHLMSAPKAEKCRWQSVISVYQRVKP